MQSITATTSSPFPPDDVRPFSFPSLPSRGEEKQVHLRPPELRKTPDLFTPSPFPVQEIQSGRAATSIFSRGAFFPPFPPPSLPFYEQSASC